MEWNLWWDFLPLPQTLQKYLGHEQSRIWEESAEGLKNKHPATLPGGEGTPATLGSPMLPSSHWLRGTKADLTPVTGGPGRCSGPVLLPLAPTRSRPWLLLVPT